MDKRSIKIIIFMIIFAYSVFCVDIIFAKGVFSVFYILVVLVSLWSDEDSLLVGATIGSTILIFGAYIHSINNFDWPTLINKLVSFVMVMVTAALSMRMKEKSQNLRRLNETLELRVLARTATSEAKAHRLEKQIEVLQHIRKEDTNNALSALDDVINNLKTLAIEKGDGENFDFVEQKKPFFGASDA